MEEGLQPDHIAVTGSPNTTTTLTFDVLSSAINSPLDGALVEIYTSLSREKKEAIAILGQVVQAQTTNRWHELPSMSGVIKVRGCIPHITGISDVTRGTISVLGVYRFNNGSWEKTTLAVPPGTGIGIKRVTMPTIEGFLQTERRIGEKTAHHAFIGQFWGTTGVYAPVNVRHFGNFEEGGLGEAWMGGIFGPTGSGKSVMAAKLITAYAHNPRMGVLLVDPQSEFSANKQKNAANCPMDFHGMLHSISQGRFVPERDVLTIDQISWDSPILMVEVLKQKNFFKTIGISRDKMKEAREDLEVAFKDLNRRLKNGWRHTWKEINADPKDAETLKTEIIAAMANSYAASARSDFLTKFEDNWTSQIGRLESAWDRSVGFFTTGQGKEDVDKVITSALEKGAIKILDINPEKVEMNDEFRNFLLDAFLTKLRLLAHSNYKNRENPTNCLIVFDEAHLFAPQNSDGDDSPGDGLASNLEKTVRTMRKMRTGFLFITQSITKIRSDIYKQLAYAFYGAGLIASDLKKMEEKDGAEAKEAYQRLPNPKQSGRYCFLVNGGIVNLGTSSRPMIIEAVGGSEEFQQVNKHLFQP